MIFSRNFWYLKCFVVFISTYSLQTCHMVLNHAFGIEDVVFNSWFAPVLICLVWVMDGAMIVYSIYRAGRARDSIKEKLSHKASDCDSYVRLLEYQQRVVLTWFICDMLVITIWMMSFGYLLTIPFIKQCDYDITELSNSFMWTLYLIFLCFGIWLMLFEIMMDWFNHKASKLHNIMICDTPAISFKRFAGTMGTVVLLGLLSHTIVHIHHTAKLLFMFIDKPQIC